MSKVSAKQRIMNFLNKDYGYNTLTVNQARARFGIENVSARIAELRQEGNVIYTNTKTLEDGRKINFYRLGSPTKALVAFALRRGFSLAA